MIEIGGSEIPEILMKRDRVSFDLVRDKRGRRAVAVSLIDSLDV
jgi:cold shock CspA family protein